LPGGIGIRSAYLSQLKIMNTTMQTDGQKFQPDSQLALGQAIGFGIVAAIIIPIVDYFKVSESRSFIRTLCVAGFSFVAVLVIVWFRSGRRGYQTLTLAEQGLTIEDKTQRLILPWNELDEIVLDRDFTLKFKSRNRRDPFNLDNLGFTKEQWTAIKESLKSRGYEIKVAKLPI
jgi:hypothetical protein